MSPLHQIGDLLRGWLLAVPLGTARLIFLLILGGLLLWVLLLPSSQVTPPERPRRARDNLKPWAALALLLQILIYSLL